jgi:cysteinyl-tRNA synthetase
MTDYFGYDVHFVMNVTDIDDKVGGISFVLKE